MKGLLGLLLLGVIAYVIWAWNSIFFDTALPPDPPNYDGDDNYQPMIRPNSCNTDPYKADDHWDKNNTSR